MRTIYRFTVPILNGVATHFFIGKIVHVECKTEDTVDFWAEIDNKQVSYTARKFEVYPTGVEIPDDAQYIGTAVSPSRIYVWHLMERLV